MGSGVSQTHYVYAIPNNEIERLIPLRRRSMLHNATNFGPYHAEGHTRKSDSSNNSIVVNLKTLTVKTTTELKNAICQDPEKYCRLVACVAYIQGTLSIQQIPHEMTNKTFKENKEENRSQTRRLYAPILRPENTGRWLLQQRTFSLSTWPVFTFSCRHAEEIHVQYARLLQRLGLEEDAYSKHFSKGLFAAIRKKTVSLRIVFRKEAYMQMKQEQSGFLRELEKHTSEMLTANEDMSLTDIVNKNKYDPVPLILIGSSVDKENVKQVLHTVHDSECRVILLFMKNTETSQTAETLESGFIEEFPSGTFACSSTTDTLLEDIDDQLERYIFETVRRISDSLLLLFRHHFKRRSGLDDITDYVDKLNSHNVFLKRNTTEDLEEHLRCVDVHAITGMELLNEIQSAYQRSNVPLSERPQIPAEDAEHATSIATLKGELMDVRHIVGTADHFGTFSVYINNDVSNEEQVIADTEVTSILQRHWSVARSIHFIPKEMNLLSNVGAKIGSLNFGTLGCFATIGDQTFPKSTVRYDSNEESNKILNDSDVRLCAVISKHVARIQPQSKIRCNNKLLGDVLQPFGDLDIAAVEIAETFKSYCELAFRNADGDQLACKLLEFNDTESNIMKNLPGCHVHIWGATSTPGLGKIVSADPDFSHLEGPYMIIEDRSAETGPFATNGDSGAIVCAIERRGRFQYAIAMLVGEYVPQDRHKTGSAARTQYFALQLKAGLEHLSALHGHPFTLCG